jgi:hypothetical protein
MENRIEDHRAAVERLRRQYAALPNATPVRLAKPTSNLFRFGGPAGRRARRLDVSAFGRVLDIDPEAAPRWSGA